MTGQTVTEDVKTRVTKSSLQEVHVMISHLIITSLTTVGHSVNLEKKFKGKEYMIPSVKRNVLTQVPGYLNRLIPTSWTLTCVKTPVRPPANIARPAPMRNIHGVSVTTSLSAIILNYGVTVTQPVMEERMNLLGMLPVSRD